MNPAWAAGFARSRLIWAACLSSSAVFTVVGIAGGLDTPKVSALGLAGLLVPVLPVLLLLTSPWAIRRHEARIARLVSDGVISAAEGRRIRARLHQAITRTYVPGYEEPPAGPNVTIQ